PQELGGTLDATERVLDLVRQPDGESAQGGQAIGTRGGRLEGTLEAQIMQDENGSAELAVPVEDGGAGRAHRRLPAARYERPLAVPTRCPLAQCAPRQLTEPPVPVARPQLADLHPDGLRVRHAEELLRRRVQIGDATRRIEHDHAILETRQHVDPRRPPPAPRPRRPFQGGSPRPKSSPPPAP